MFDVNGFNIKLTRGDTANFHVTITENNEPYILSDTDELILVVRKNAIDSKVFLKIKGDKNANFVIYPKDTKNMYFGHYDYFIRLIINPDEVYSIIPISDFEILEEL